MRKKATSTATEVIVHSIPLNHPKVGQPVTAYCGERFIVGLTAQRYNPRDPTPAFRCPICEATRIAIAAAPKLIQGTLF